MIPQQQNVIRYKEFYEQMQPLLITNYKLLPVLPEYNIEWVNLTEHDNAILYDSYIVRLQSSKFHLNKDANRIAYRNLAYYF